MMEKYRIYHSAEVSVEDLIRLPEDVITPSERIVLQHIYSRIFDELNRITFGVE